MTLSREAREVERLELMLTKRLEKVADAERKLRAAKDRQAAAEQRAER